MAQDTDFRSNFTVRGAMYALTASIIGSIILAVTPFLHFVATSETTDATRIALEVNIMIIMTIYFIILASVPAAIGGTILAIKLKNDYQNGQLSYRSAFLKGTLAGAVSVSTVIIFVGFLMEVMFWSKGRGSIQGFLFFSTESLLIAVVAGGLVGNRLAAYLKNQ